MLRRQRPPTATQQGATGVASAGAPAATVAGQAPPELVLERGEIAGLLAAYKSLPRDLDRSAFDVKAKASALGSDPTAAFAFVRDGITNEVYPGVLRGAAGTLQARAGNDLDKSVLLAALLSEAGHSTRFARCTLEPQAADTRLAQLFAEPAAAASRQVDVGPALTAALVRQGLSDARASEIVSTRSATRAWLDGAILETARADLAVVRGAMDRADLRAPERAPEARPLEDARNHYWVQVSRGSSWEDLDPAVPDARPGSTLCTPADIYAELPAESFQAITVSIRNEYIEGEALRSESVLSTKFKAAALYGRVLTFTNVGTGTSEGQLQPADLGRFIPFLTTGEEVLPGTEYGRPPSSSQGAGGLFAAFGEAMTGGEAPLLAAQWIDFVLEAPSRRTGVSRALVDFVNPKERTEGVIRTKPDRATVALALTRSAAIAVSAGPIHPAAVIQEAYGDLDPAAVGLAFDAPAEPRDGGADALESWGLTGDVLLGAQALAYAAASERARASLSDTAGPHVRLTRDQPAITIANVTIRTRPDGTNAPPELSIDFRHNRIRVVTDSVDRAAEGFWANATYGLAAGALEHHLPATAVRAVHSAPLATEMSFDTCRALQLARSQGIELRAQSGASARELLLGALADTGGRRLAREVTDITAIIVPARAPLVQDEPRLGLWAVNLQSGELLSLLDTGLRGQATAEGKLQRYINFAEAQVRRCVANRTNMEACRRMFQSWADAVNKLHKMMDVSSRVILNNGHFVMTTL